MGQRCYFSDNHLSHQAPTLSRQIKYVYFTLLNPVITRHERSLNRLPPGYSVAFKRHVRAVTVAVSGLTERGQGVV